MARSTSGKRGLFYYDYIHRSFVLYLRILTLPFQNDKTIKIISQEEMETLRRPTDQSLLTRGRAISTSDDDDDDGDDDDNENSNLKSQSQDNKGKTRIIAEQDELEIFALENDHSKTNIDQQPRSPAINIIRSNIRQVAPPQVEPFYRPKAGPLPNTQGLSEPINNTDFVSHSLPINTEIDIASGATLATKSNTIEKNTRSKASNENPEEPRTPHSRAKNIARFYPVTKDAPVVKPDVNSLSFFFQIQLLLYIVFFSFELDARFETKDAP